MARVTNVPPLPESFDSIDSNGSDVESEKDEEKAGIPVPISQIPLIREPNKEEQDRLLKMLEARYKYLHSLGYRQGRRSDNEFEKEITQIYHRRRRLLARRGEIKSKNWWSQ